MIATCHPTRDLSMEAGFKITIVVRDKLDRI